MKTSSQARATSGEQFQAQEPGFRSMRFVGPHCLIRVLRNSKSMSLSARITPHLPYLRRFAHAIAGSQYRGDAYVAATLESLIHDIEIFPLTSSDRVGLCKLFLRFFNSVDGPEIGQRKQVFAGFKSSTAARQALLLTAIEGFSEAETMEILEVTEDELHALLEDASDEPVGASRSASSISRNIRILPRRSNV